MINIEIKAKCQNQERIREILKSRNALFQGMDHQVDTYFRVPQGRLKLREGIIENALIYYEREYANGPKKSAVLLYQDPRPTLKDILSKSLGVVSVIDKQREIYRIGNLKVHIDIVNGLGSFVEIEAIDEDGTIGETRLRQQCEEYVSLFEIADDHLLPESYSDLMPQQGENQK